MGTGVWAVFKLLTKPPTDCLMANRLGWFCIGAAIENAAILIIFMTVLIKTIAGTLKFTARLQSAAEMGNQN